MKKVEEIKQELSYGDYKQISEIATRPGKKPTSKETITSISPAASTSMQRYASSGASKN